MQIEIFCSAPFWTKIIRQFPHVFFGFLMTQNENVKKEVGVKNSALKRTENWNQECFQEIPCSSFLGWSLAKGSCNGENPLGLD